MHTFRRNPLVTGPLNSCLPEVARVPGHLSHLAQAATDSTALQSEAHSGLCSMPSIPAIPAVASR